ncbi:MAG: hypothetical protein H0U53_06810 [Actinobacteria bacterium]|nr:hypothetical protein [Actinomycetota bacterium]
MMVAMSEAVVYLLCGAIVALTAGCVAAFASARKKLQAADSGPRTILSAVGHLMIAWVGVALASLVVFSSFCSSAS